MKKRVASKESKRFSELSPASKALYRAWSNEFMSALADESADLTESERHVEGALFSRCPACKVIKSRE